MGKKKGLIKRWSVLIFIFVVIISCISFTVSHYFQSKKSYEKNKESVKAKSVNTSKLKKTAKKTVKNVELKYNNEGVPVLMYHSIGTEKNNPIRMPKEKFREQMKYLKDNDYTTITLDQLYKFFAYNTPVPKKSVVITFDDGYSDNYNDAYPILKEFGFKAVIFVITGTVDKDVHYLTSQEIKEMTANGIDIESHTVNHDKLRELSYKGQTNTMGDAKSYIEKLLDKRVSCIAYPFGQYNSQTIKAAQALGYSMAFTTVDRWANKSNGMFTLSRVYMNAFDSMDVFKDRVSNPNYKTK